VSVIQIPYVDNINMNDVHTALEGLISEVETRPKATPIA